LGDPTLPLSLPSAVWFFLNELHWPHLSNTVKSTRRAWSPQESYPARPSQSAAADQLLSWVSLPYSTWGIEGPLVAGVAARHVPPSGFDYPLDGLLPSMPCQSCFVPAALLGFALRSLLLLKGNRVVSDSEEPTYRWLVCIPSCRSTGAGLTSCDFWALTLSRVPDDQTHV